MIMLFKKSVNIPKFKIYLEELRRKYFFDDLCIYVDNLSVHKSDAVQERMEELSIKCIFNLVYSPDFNPIENIFSVAKRSIKLERLKAIMHNTSINLHDEINRSFDKID